MNQAAKNREEVENINNRFMKGELTIEEAKAELKPIADSINKKAKEIASKYNMRPRLVHIQVTMSHGAKLR